MSSSTNLLPNSRGPRLRNLVIVGQAHPGARYVEALGNAEEHVIGHDAAALDDLGDFGLGLSGQLGDLSLADVSLGEQSVDGGDVPFGQRPAGGLGCQRAPESIAEGFRGRRWCCRGVWIRHRLPVALMVVVAWFVGFGLILADDELISFSGVIMVHVPALRVVSR
jgi:hypothetical protein